MNNEKFGSFICELRKQHEMTQKMLGDKLNISNKAISKWERGLNFPDISLLENLASILGVSVLELLSGERKKDEVVTKQEAEDVIKNTIHQGTIKQKATKRNNLIYKFIIFFLIILIIFGGIMAVRAINQKTIFNLKNSIMKDDYTINRLFKTYEGQLLEQDVLYSGKLTEDSINEYVENLKISDNVIAIDIVFYEVYDDSAKTQPFENIKCEYKKYLID